jgi:hypothetical protein
MHDFAISHARRIMSSPDSDPDYCGSQNEEPDLDWDQSGPSTQQDDPTGPFSATYTEASHMECSSDSPIRADELEFGPFTSNDEQSPRHDDEVPKGRASGLAPVL